MLKEGHILECFTVHKREYLRIKRVTKLVFNDVTYPISGTGYPAKALQRYLLDIMK